MDALRAWKDPEYRASLTSAQRTQLPVSPVGVVELNDADLANMKGGAWTPTTITPASWVAGCFTINNSLCNGTCAVNTTGCCGG